MEYSNPKIPEEINYSSDNPLKEFFLLVAGIFLLLAFFVAVAHLFAQTFAQYIPFSYEEKLLPLSYLAGGEDVREHTVEQKNTQQYLQKLALQLASNMDLPDEMQLHIQYSESEEINAAATLNGLIIINQGLIDFVKSENELAFVLAHEIAHIKARHPIKSLSSGIIVGIAISVISGSIDNEGAATALLAGTTLTSLSFSRTQEEEADALALEGLHAHYGHTKGSYDFFARMDKAKHLPGFLQFVSTHPGMQDRILDIQSLAKKFYDNNSVNAVLTPLPALME